MRWLPIIFLAASCHAQQALLLSGGATVPLPAASGPAITNTTAGLVNWWKFDENAGTNAADSAGSANGTFEGTPLWQTGQINSALFFQTGALRDLLLSTNTATGDGPFTIQAWVYIFSTNQTGGTVLYDSDNDNLQGYSLNLGANNIDLLVVATSDLIRSGVARAAVEGWTHVVASWGGVTTDASTVHIYTNGGQVAGYGLTQDGSGVHTANTTNRRYIGGGDSGGAGNFNGAIDGVQIWNRALSQGEITNMYTLGLQHRNQ